MSDTILSPQPLIATRPLVTVPQPIGPTAPARRLQRSDRRGDWRCVRYSWRWLAASLGASAAGALVINQAWASGNWALALAAGTAAAAVGAYATLVEPARPVLERVELRLPKLPPALHGLRVMQLSDMHLGSRYSRRNLVAAVEMVRHERPDLVVMTGDFVHAPEPIDEIAQLLKGVGAPLGCYAVLGNHDYWEGPQEVVDALAGVGVETLINENRKLRWHGGEFWLLGVDEPWCGAPCLASAARGLPESDFKLLLAHAPEAADEAVQHGIDLQLSGHTHGGHLNLPLLGAFALPYHGWRYEMGLARVGPTTVYTNRGLGGMGLRLNCAPEVTLLTLLCPDEVIRR